MKNIAGSIVQLFQGFQWIDTLNNPTYLVWSLIFIIDPH